MIEAIGMEGTWSTLLRWPIGPKKNPVVLQPKLRSPQAENPLHSLALCTCLHWFLLDSGTGASVAMQGPEHLVSCNQFRILCDILFGWLWVTSVANAALRVSSCTVLDPIVCIFPDWWIHTSLIFAAFEGIWHLSCGVKDQSWRRIARRKDRVLGRKFQHGTVLQQSGGPCNVKWNCGSRRWTCRAPRSTT